MDTLLGIIVLLIQIEVVLILIRVALSWFGGIDPYNPLVRLLRAVVDPVLRPFRRILPTFGGIDFSPLLATIVLYEVAHLITIARDQGSVSVAHETGVLIEEILLNVAIVFIVIALLRVFISLFHASPWHPAVMVIRQLSTPLVRPFAAIAPRSRSVDTAAMVALAVYVVAYIVIKLVFNQVLG